MANVLIAAPYQQVAALITPWLLAMCCIIHLRKRSLQVYIAFTLHVMNFFCVYNTIRIAQIVQMGGDVRNIFEFAAEKLGTLAAL